MAPPIAQASDYWGRRIFILIGTVLCFIGSMLIARTISMPMAIAGGTLLGIGSGTTSLLYAVSSEILPRRYRPMAQAGVNSTNSLGGIFTLLAGFYFVKKFHEGWRILWYISAGMYVIGFLVIFFLYNPPRRPMETEYDWKQKVRALDWIGYLLFSAGIILFSIALTWSNNPYSWGDAHVLATFIVGIVFIALFIGWEIKIPHGFFDHGLFNRGRNFALALVLIFVEGITFYGFNAFVPFEFSVLFETDLMKVGLLVSIVFFGGMTSSLLGGFYSAKAKRVRPPLVLGMLLFVLYFGKKIRLQ
jgi:MFS family permease